jgi:hypothetical protein
LTYLVRAKEVKAEMACRSTKLEADAGEVAMAIQRWRGGTQLWIA